MVLSSQTPLDDVQRLSADGEGDRALILCRRVTRDLAAVEALIASDVIRFTGLRPALTALNRAAVLQVFGIDPSLTVFTNFLEAAHTVAELPRMFEQEFAPELLELYKRLGLTARPHGSFDQAVASVHRLAGAVLEVSWQFAVCAVERGCDPSFVGPLEKTLAAYVIESDLPMRRQVQQPGT